MKKIKYCMIWMAGLLTASCVEDKVYEGPSTIESVVINPEAPTSDDAVTVTAVVSGLQTVKSATLDYTAGGTSGSVDMQASGSGAYTATIPAQADRTTVTYKVTVLNKAGYTTVSSTKEYTVGDAPVDYAQLVLNELYGAASDDAGKFIELYNNGDKDIKLKDVTLKKDEELTWSGMEGEVIPAHGWFAVVGAKGTTERGFSSGFSAKKSVLVELFDPNGNKLDAFQRGEKDTGWGDQSLTNVKGSWSRCPDGTGRWMITDPTVNAANPTTGTADDTVKQ